MEYESSFHFDVNVSQEDISFIWDQMRAFNRYSGPMLKYPPYEPYGILLKDNNNKVIAGILTRIYLKCMNIEVFWIEDQYRRKGFGSALLKSVEKHAKEKGCTFVHLDTFSFQAIEFYKKYGYSVFGVIEDYPDDIKRYYLKKYL